MQPKKKQQSFTNDSFLEQIRGLTTGTSKALKQDLLKGGAKTAWNQLRGGFEMGPSFEQMTPPEAVERKEIRKRAAYEPTNEIVLFSASERKTMQEIENIRIELMTLVKVVKEVDFEVQKAVIEIPVKPGVYHIRFLEKIKSLLKLIRQKLEDSRTWLKLATSKKKARGYWSMYKKKGTSFGLSGERVVSTQTG